jgi:hypothetical protein
MLGEKSDPGVWQEATAATSQPKTTNQHRPFQSSVCILTFAKANLCGG